jgi:hypothetical protein
MLALRHAKASDLAQVASWLKSATDCANWAGNRVVYPVRVMSLALDIQWEIATSMGLFSADSMVGCTLHA